MGESVASSYSKHNLFLISFFFKYSFWQQELNNCRSHARESMQIFKKMFYVLLSLWYFQVSSKFVPDIKGISLEELIVLYLFLVILLVILGKRIHISRPKDLGQKVLLLLLFQLNLKFMVAHVPKLDICWFCLDHV